MTATEKFNFRIRFLIADTHRLPFSGDNIELTSHDEQHFTLSAFPAGPLSDTRSFSLVGGPFVTREEAVVEAERWQGKVSIALTALLMAASFGDPSMNGGFTSDLMNDISKELDVEMYNDHLGITVYPATGKEVFSGMGSTSFAVLNSDSLLRALLSEHNESDLVGQRRLAFELYSLSRFVASEPKASFMCSMMAIETLIKREKRSDKTQALLDSFLQQVRDAGLPEEEALRIPNGLSDLREDSIKQAGMRLCKTLDDRLYMGVSASQFFSDCYAIRGKLVHGQETHKSQADFNQMAAALSWLAADLIAGRALTDEIRG